MRASGFSTPSSPESMTKSSLSMRRSRSISERIVPLEFEMTAERTPAARTASSAVTLCAAAESR
jgi:hypothetical protein